MTRPTPLPEAGVCVIVAAYNAQATIGRAVRSALRQQGVSEVYVIDDASDDETIATAAACDDGGGRLVILRQPSNQGPAAARNLALSLTTADWVCVLDADDYFLPGRIARLLADAGEADLVADELIRTRETSPATITHLSTPAGDPRRIDFEAFVSGNVSREGRPRQELGFIKPLTRTAFLRRHGLVYDERLRLGEDYEFYARALARGARMVLSPPRGYVAVERAGSLSGRHSEEDLRRLRDCDQGLAALRPLSAGERQALRRHAASVDSRLQWRLMINAVKARDGVAALRTFTSWKVGSYLVARLAEQAWLRSVGRLGAKSGTARPTSPRPAAPRLNQTIAK
jgi:succinoglycan biosynthesis protein ExoU